MIIPQFQGCPAALSQTTLTMQRSKERYTSILFSAMTAIDINLNMAPMLIKEAEEQRQNERNKIFKQATLQQQSNSSNNIFNRSLDLDLE